MSPYVPSMRVGDLATSSVVPEATYELSCKSVKYIPQEGMKDGKEVFPYCSFDWVVTGPDTAEEHVGRHVFDNGVTLKPGANWKLHQICAALGLAPDEDLYTITGEFRTDLFTDGQLSAVVVVEPPSKGKDGRDYPERNTIKRYLSL